MALLLAAAADAEGPAVAAVAGVLPLTLPSSSMSCGRPLSRRRRAALALRGGRERGVADEGVARGVTEPVVRLRGVAATPIGRDVRAAEALLLGVALMLPRGVAAVVAEGRAMVAGRARGVVMVDEGVEGGRTRPVPPPMRCADDGAGPTVLLGPAPRAVASFVGLALLVGMDRKGAVACCLGVAANAPSSFPLSAPGLTLIEA